MYVLSKFCCICMNKSDLKRMFDVDNDGVSHYNKLTSSIAEMDFKEMNNRRLICEECCVTLDSVYNFRKRCLRSKTNLITYISQLRTYSPVSGELSVRLKDIKQNIMIVTEEIEIKCENEDSSFEENNQQNEFQTGSSEDSIQFSASVKEECKSEEDSSEDEEDDEHQTMMEYDPEFIKIDFERVSVAEVKEEPFSDSEKPQDGSTSQGTSGELNKSEETIIKTEHEAPRGTYKSERCQQSSNQKVDEKQFQCELCKEIFNKKPELETHMLVHSGERIYTCKICKKNFLHEFDHIQHIQSHFRKYNAQCNICPTRLPNKDHMWAHSGERPYSNEMNQKPSCHHKLERSERVNECELCNEIFCHKLELKAHMVVHSGKRLYECKLCQKKFVRENNLKAHVRSHSKFHCEFDSCSEVFYCRESLGKHMVIHYGERPFTCKCCYKTFRHSSSLAKHRGKNFNYKLFSCEICGKSYTRQFTLSSHMRTHSGEKPFKCEICQKEFSLKGVLNRHMQKHIDDNNINTPGTAN